jgi:hypothetical protein
VARRAAADTPNMARAGSGTFGTCGIDAVLGRAAPCPGPTCPFWDGDSCLFARLDLRGRRSVAQWLVDLRNAADVRRRDR